MYGIIVFILAALAGTTARAEVGPSLQRINPTAFLNPQMAEALTNQAARNFADRAKELKGMQRDPKATDDQKKRARQEVSQAANNLRGARSVENFARRAGTAPESPGLSPSAQRFGASNPATGSGFESLAQRVSPGGSPGPGWDTLAQRVNATQVVNLETVCGGGQRCR